MRRVPGGVGVRRRPSVRKNIENRPDWAVVLASPTDEDFWISSFFDTEAEARAFMERSKAGAHDFSLRLYHAV